MGCVRGEISTSAKRARELSPWTVGICRFSKIQKRYFWTVVRSFRTLCGDFFPLFHTPVLPLIKRKISFYYEKTTLCFFVEDAGARQKVSILVPESVQIWDGKLLRTFYIWDKWNQENLARNPRSSLSVLRLEVLSTCNLSFFEMFESYVFNIPILDPHIPRSPKSLNIPRSPQIHTSPDPQNYADMFAHLK